MSKLLAGVSLALALGVAAPASAAVLLSQPGVSEFRSTPGSYTYYFDTVEEGVVLIGFDIVALGSLDGQGATCDLGDCTDQFTLILNGGDLFQATFRLGGEGVDAVQYAAGGAILDIQSGAPGEGGVAKFWMPVWMQAGTNNLTFVYSGLDEGRDNESWAIGDLLVQDGRAGVVPEPSTWALMIGGFGLAGAALRRRRGAVHT